MQMIESLISKRMFAAELPAVGGLNRVPCVGEPKTFVTGPAAALAACPNAGTDCDAA